MITNYYLLSLLYLTGFSTLMLGILQLFKALSDKRDTFSDRKEYGF